ncbi:YggS family pyridoxal phosphate-dependent enzyme [Neptunomonas concharum]|uniref:Pyridoxal phosphate homeostasis protein n=1 Tax=Neptunomonas concharum TaxID=1031538 RepID=A0A5P1R860_9GAMM|nr:YggS family pyridoxal phosphate-dependent enzyme [Neptunomonas concharum]QEQ95472.1 YggS family pyridoxal phosphate-dependent enzyme [Neptunomonas concharum]
MSSIAENFQSVRQQIDQAATQSARMPQDIHLLAVSKTRQPDELRALYQLGQTAFGENYLQEALDKIEALNDLPITWHFIGPIQSNKTRAIAEHFSWVHSVDRLKIAQRLSEQRPATLPPLNICLQINISKEDSKAGCLPNEAETLLNQMALLPNIVVRGLMAIPKATTDSEAQAHTFTQMQTLFHELKKQHPLLDTLSMGMSDDMAVAIAHGATVVRIGTALFGPRHYPQN